MPKRVCLVLMAGWVASSFCIAALASDTWVVSRWNFDRDKAGELPAELEPISGQWVVMADSSAPSQPNVLAQISTATVSPGIVVKNSDYRDASLQVKFKTISGQQDQAAGIIFEYHDPENLYLFRANANENNAILFEVANGQRVAVRSIDIAVPSNRWITFGVDIRGMSLACYFNGEKLFTVRNDRPQGGKIGLWTKTDSIVYFDDFTAKRPE